MQTQRTPDSALTLAADPARVGLTAEDVVGIHRAHQDGQAWQAIAERFETSRKNVQRIVQGRRWRELHPTLRPDLYEQPDSEPAQQPKGYTRDEIEQAARAGLETFLASLKD